MYRFIRTLLLSIAGTSFFCVHSAEITIPGRLSPEQLVIGRELLRAAKENDIRLVRSLLRRRTVPINVHNGQGNTALMEAAYAGNLSIVSDLMTAGAQVDLKNSMGNSALMQAAHNGNHEMLRLLITGGAQVNLRNTYGWTALMWAVINGNNEDVTFLLTANADVNVQGRWGETALILAVQKNNVSIVRSLLQDATIRIDARNHDKKTALDIAREHHYEELVKLLTAYKDQHDEEIMVKPAVSE